MPPNLRPSNLARINSNPFMKKYLPRSLAGLFLAAALVGGVITNALSQPNTKAISLFNGRDLTGWGYKTNNFDGKMSSIDGRYSAKDGILTVNPGKGLAQLWTTREFPNDFVLTLEFRADVNADSGIFLRKPQLQCRDYLVAGPYKALKKYKPQDWNEIVVTVKNGVAHCTCNGEVLEAALALPATGPIGLEADRGQMEYRNLLLRPTP